MYDLFSLFTLSKENLGINCEAKMCLLYFQIAAIRGADMTTNTDIKQNIDMLLKFLSAALVAMSELQFLFTVNHFIRSHEIFR